MLFFKHNSVLSTIKFSVVESTTILWIIEDTDDVTVNLVYFIGTLWSTFQRLSNWVNLPSKCRMCFKLSSNLSPFMLHIEMAKVNDNGNYLGIWCVSKRYYLCNILTSLLARIEFESSKWLVHNFSCAVFEAYDRHRSHFLCNSWVPLFLLVFL